MKTKIFLLVTFAFSLLPLALFPQGFSYQAVVRNAAGEVMAGQSVSFRISLLQGSESGTVVYEETHQETTSPQGLVNLVIGEGSAVSGNFALINWADGPWFLKTEFDPAGGNNYSLAETRPLQPVPFAKLSERSEAISAGKLEIKGDESQNPEEALFEVKRNDGQTVFAVYPDGVRIYVEDLPGKGSKGGFAVGGFDPAKGLTDDYIWVTPDSVRIYVSAGEGKSSKGGFAVGGFSPGKKPAVNFLDLTPENYFIGHLSGSNNTTGLYNSSLGFEAGKSNTKGNYNIFIGYQSGFSNLDGEYNTAIGYQTAFSNLGPLDEGVTGGSYGSFNSYIGYKAGYAGVHGAHNTFVGYASGHNNQSDNNTFLGSLSGSQNTSGYSNTFIGTEAGQFNSTGSGNAFLGRWAGWNVENGNANTLIGSYAGTDLRSGNGNVIVGYGAMAEQMYGAEGTASQNVIIGCEAGRSALHASGNIFIGYNAGYEETGSNLLYMSNSATPTPLVYGNFTEDYFRVNGTLEATIAIVEPSDIRLKTNISQLTGVIEKLVQIKGVNFEWNMDNEANMLLIPGKQVGVIAQEVEPVFPELVKTNDKGYKTVDYTKLTPILLEAIKEQQLQIEQLQKEVARINGLEKKYNLLLEKSLPVQ